MIKIGLQFDTLDDAKKALDKIFGTDEPTPEKKEEKPKRVRKTKKETAEKPADPKGPTREDALESAKGLMAKGAEGSAKLREILSTFKASKFSELTADNYVAFMAACAGAAEELE